jgi:outer membrane protein assembly factor BamB
MSYNDGPFTPDKIDERLAHDGKHSDDMQSDSLPRLVPLQTQWEKRSTVKEKIFSSQRRFIESIAAVLIVAILVGSLALVLNSIHQSQQGATYTNLPPAPGIYTASDTTVYKYDARTGAPSWQYTSGANWLNLFYSAPKVVGNSVYAPSNNGLYMLNASTGKLQWKQQWTENTITNLNVFPLVRGNVVLVATVNGVSQGYATPGSMPTHPTATANAETLHALDTTTGKELWSKPLPFGQAAICASCAPGTNNTLYIVSNGALYAINLEDGSQSWSTPVTGSGQDIVASNGAVYLGNDVSGAFRAFDKQSGKLLWNTSLQQGYQITYLQANSSIVYLTAAKGKNYYEVAYDEQTGTRLWKFSVATMIKSEPLINQNMLYISTQNGYMYALDAQSGKKLWSYHADGDLYFSTMDNNIFYLEVGDAHTWINEHEMAADGKQLFTLHSIVALGKNGTMLQHYTLAQNLTPQELVVGNGIIYLIAASGFATGLSFFPNDFVAFRTIDGEQLWQQKLPDHIVVGTIVVP